MLLFPDQDETRKIYCQHYESCLTQAAKADLQQMQCRGCTRYQYDGDKDSLLSSTGTFTLLAVILASSEDFLNQGYSGIG